MVGPEFGDCFLPVCTAQIGLTDPQATMRGVSGVCLPAARSSLRLLYRPLDKVLPGADDAWTTGTVVGSVVSTDPIGTRGWIPTHRLRGSPHLTQVARTTW